MGKVVAFPSVGKPVNRTALSWDTEDVLRVALELKKSLSDQDRNTLDFDLLSRDPSSPSLPSALRESFGEWLSEYHAIEREDMMAPENEGETHRRFAEEFIEAFRDEDDALALVELARFFLENKKLALASHRSLEADSSMNPSRPTP